MVARARLADAQGDLPAAAKAYEEAIAIEDALAYMEPPFWYYPIRQSLGSVYLRQGKLDEAEKALRDSLARVRSNGWALAGVAEVYKRKGDTKEVFTEALAALLKRPWRVRLMRVPGSVARHLISPGCRLATRRVSFTPVRAGPIPLRAPAPDRRARASPAIRV